MKVSHLHCLTTEMHLMCYQMDMDLYLQTIRRAICIRATFTIWQELP